MAQSTNVLSLVINRQDANGVNVENRSVGSISYAGVAGEFDIRSAPDTSIHSLDLPTTTVRQFYIKNTHATAILLITGTITGGASQSIAKLGPGDALVIWGTSSASPGFSSLSYTSDTSGSTFEMFIGG